MLFSTNFETSQSAHRHLQLQGSFEKKNLKEATNVRSKESGVYVKTAKKYV